MILANGQTLMATVMVTGQFSQMEIYSLTTPLSGAISIMMVLEIILMEIMVTSALSCTDNPPFQLLEDAQILIMMEL